ncbi:hypothetical protein PDIG_70910 [Penicillium digitatum PHI26]|uniref:Uncharacterized protein n=2 Tax=Penicillium digitatum TaxID=36651 RepID=K9FF03_PEND2|nr:hypothetical protein PDIP_80230 [Penicillium digitatum Pd1]EKV06312.1 hypothetical protein PDIP_80230 [Penicillium digitatum Pd1]EKV08015.1 hypothetical protein PDIG_70910 [Penicillium digitatum PHI26]
MKAFPDVDDRGHVMVLVALGRFASSASPVDLYFQGIRYLPSSTL